MDRGLRQKFCMLTDHLNERQRRLAAAIEAKIIGYGGVSIVSRASGLSRQSIHKGLKELESEEVLVDRVRKEGGGRRKVWENNPKILKDLEVLVRPTTRGDPMSPLRWTCKSMLQLAEALGKRGYEVSHRTVGKMLKELGYSLQATRKTLEGKQHPDRDAQFRYINRQVSRFLGAGRPVISVDTKKKELIGKYARKGREYRPKGRPEKVRVHDFIDRELGKVIPYGVYDVAKDLGWVNVGCDHDTAAFAVESIRRWWNVMGLKLYFGSGKLLICADAGGSNGYRTRQWKAELQALADELGMEVTVCHLPPGTSKWNKIEHRLFSHISVNWRGRPLVSHEVVVKLIRATKTGAGLKVKAALDKRKYPTKVKISDDHMAELNLAPHSFHGDWNYTIKPSVKVGGKL